MAQFLISPAALQRNAAILQEVAQQSGAHLLVALKAFSSPSCMKYLQPYAAGCCASGLYEARLGARHLGGHVAVYSPAYREDELRELLDFAHHIDFNSLPQWQRHRELCLAHPRAGKNHNSTDKPELQFGLRVNPCFSTGHTPLYDPCIPGSRLGIPTAQLRDANLTGISGLHLHTLCEQGARELADTFHAFESEARDILALPQIRYLNLGGGHWITKPEYDRSLLISLIRDIRDRYQLDVYLEPGEAWCIHTGILRATVLDIFDSLGYRHAILDVSASAHMPDVLEMPYRPDVFAVSSSPGTPQADPGKSILFPAVQLADCRYEPAGRPGEHPHTYRLGAPTCLAGDVIGDYSFTRQLRVGDELVFDDMTHYTIVKTTHFNGVPHPSIALLHRDGRIEETRRFHYQDFESRLG